MRIDCPLESDYSPDQELETDEKDRSDLVLFLLCAELPHPLSKKSRTMMCGLCDGVNEKVLT